MNQEQLEEKLNEINEQNQELRKTASELVVSVQNLEGLVEKNKLSFPADVYSKKIIEEVIRKKIIDFAWNDYFRQYTAFESIDGYDILSGGASIDETGITITTSATSGNQVFLLKDPTIDNWYTMDKESRFRVGVIFTNSTANAEGSLGIGAFGDNDQFYGFEFKNNELYGTCADDTARTTAFLQNINNTSAYLLEAKYSAGEKVEFLINGESLGSINTNLPFGTLVLSSEVFGSIPELRVKTNENAVKSMKISLFEYIQRR